MLIYTCVWRTLLFRILQCDLIYYLEFCRYYGAMKIKPAFCFGHGLSYTNFSYSNLSVRSEVVEFDVLNVGKLPGAEVAQM